MPQNKPSVFRLSRAYVEHVHDAVVACFWPGSQPIQPNEYRDPNLLDSAVNRPFQSFGGEELYKSLFEKSAALFHSLVCNHCFTNGNKRTAIISLDHFLCANDYVLGLRNTQLYGLALKTARHNEKGIPTHDALQTIIRSLTHFAIPIESLNRKGLTRLYQSSILARKSVRANPLNR